MPQTPDPSGQKPTNPFFSNLIIPGKSQGMMADVQLNTSSAKVAFDDLEKLFKKLTKSMGADWDDFTNESLKKQETLFRALGMKQDEHKAKITRLKNEALSAIEEERKKKLDSLAEEMKTAEGNAARMKQLESEKLATETKAISDKANIESSVKKNLARETGMGGILRGMTSDIGAKVGGPIGGIISGAGELLTNPYALGAMAIFEMFKTKAAFTSTGATLAGAGFKLGSGAGVGLNFDQRLFGANPFGRLNQALSQDEQKAIIAQMAGSRTMIGQTQTAGGFDAVRNNLGLFANILPDAAKDMELMVDATKNLGMSQKDITNTFVSSRVNAERLKVTQLDAIKTQMDMAKVLRNLTNDGALAANTLSNITDYLNAIGASEAEKQRIGVAVATGAANLTLSQLTGMFAFTHGGKIANPLEMFGSKPVGGIGPVMPGAIDNPFQLMGSFLTQVGGQFKNPTQRMFAAEQLQKEFLPGLRLQDIPKFFDLAQDMMKPGANPADFQKRFEALEQKTPQVAMAEGIKTLSEIVDPIKRLENVFTNFWSFVDDRINKVIQSFPGHKLFSIGHQTGQWIDKNILHRPDHTGNPTSEGRWKDSKGNWHTPH